MASFTAHVQEIQQPGAHSKSSNPGDFENISKADQLEVNWFQEQEAKHQKKEVSNALVPPPAPPPGSCNILSSLSSNVKVPIPMVSPHPQATKKVSVSDNNSQLEVVDLLVKEEVGKEIFLLPDRNGQ